MVTAGFWYVKERDEKSDGEEMLSETVIVMLRRPARGIGLFQQLEIVADKLVEKINKTKFIETFYDFDGSRLSKHS